MTRSAGAAGLSAVYVVEGTTGGDRGFGLLVELMGRHGLPLHCTDRVCPTGAPQGLLAPDDVVIVKVNGQWAERGGTNTDLLGSVIAAILGHPDGHRGEVIVADNGQKQFGSTGRGGNFSFTHNNAEDRSRSIQRVVDSFPPGGRVSARLWDDLTSTAVAEYEEGDDTDGYVLFPEPNRRTESLVSYPKFRTAHGTRLSFRKGVWDPTARAYAADRLKIVNLSMIKSHVVCGVTGCVKNYMGVVSDRLTARRGFRAHDTIATGGLGTEIVETRVPALNIVDAIWVNPHPGRGPATRYADAVRLNTVAAGVDPFALDAWAARHLLLPAARRLGYPELSSLDPDIVEPGSFGDWMRRSLREFRRAGIPATMDEDSINVHASNLGAVPGG